MSNDKIDKLMKQLEDEVAKSLHRMIKMEYDFEGLEEKNFEESMELLKKLLEHNLIDPGKEIEDPTVMHDILESFYKYDKKLEELMKESEETKTQKMSYEQEIENIITDFFGNVEEESLAGEPVYSFGEMLEDVQLGAFCTREGWKSNQMYVFLETVLVEETEQDILFISVNGDVRQYIPDNVDLFACDWKVLL